MTYQAKATPALLTGVLLLVTLGEGGGSAAALAVWHGAAALLFLVTLWTVGGESRPVAGPAAVLWPLAAFGALFLAGALRAPYGYAALLTSLELACCFAVAWSAMRVGWPLLRAALLPLLLGAALHGLHGIWHWLQGVRRPASTFLNPNHAGLWIAAVLLIWIGGTPSGRGRAQWACPLLAGLASVGLLLTGSRGAFLALLAGASWLLWTRRSSLLPRLRLAAVLGAVALVCLAAWAQLRRERHADPFRYHRLQIWRASLVALVESPLWGTGPGQFESRSASFSFADGEGPLRFDRHFSQTHSDLLRLPCELGLPAALAFLLATGLALRHITRRRASGELPPEADGAIAALLAIAVHALVDNPSQWPAVYLLGSALAGALLSTPAAAGAVVRLRLRWLLVASVLIAYALADLAPYLAWRELRGLPRGRLDPGQHERLERALRLNPIHPGSWLRRAEHLASEADWDLDRYAEARECAERAIRLAPEEARFEVGLGRIEARASTTILPGRPTRDRALEHYRRAENLARNDAFIPLFRAMLLIDTGDPAAAVVAAERALALEPESVLPRIVLADALSATGDVERAAGILADAKERASRWAGWRGSTYGEELLQPAPSVYQAVERRLATVAGAP